MSPFLPGLIGAPLMPSCAPRMTAGRQGVTVSGCDKWGGVADDPPFAGRAAGFESGRLEGPPLHGPDGIGDWTCDSWGDGRSSGGNSTEVRGGGVCQTMPLVVGPGFWLAEWPCLGRAISISFLAPGLSVVGARAPLPSSCPEQKVCLELPMPLSCGSDASCGICAASIASRSSCDSRANACGRSFDSEPSGVRMRVCLGGVPVGAAICGSCCCWCCFDLRPSCGFLRLTL